MITLLTSPTSPALAKNPMAWKFRVTDSMGDLYGAKPGTATLECNNGTFQIGDSVTISWTDEEGLAQSLTFSAVASPSSIVQVQAAPLTLAGYEAIADKIQAHYRIAPVFELSVVENTPTNFSIIATARDARFDYEVVWDNADLSGTTAVTDEAPVGDNTPDNLQMLFEVYFESVYGSGDYNRVATMRGFPDQNGEAIFDVSHIIWREMLGDTASPPLPAFDNDVTVLADNLRNYYVRYREQYDGISDVDRAWVHLGTSSAMLGGIAQALFAETSFLLGLDADSSLLTWYPDGKTVAPAQPEYLPWYNYTDSTKNVVVELVRYTAAGAQATLFRMESGIDIEPQQTALVPVGYDQLNINNTDVLKYTVRLVDETSDYEGGSPVYLSPARTFYVDHDYYEEQRFLMYLNSFFCPVTLRCIGEHTKEVEVSRQLSEQVLAPDYVSDISQRYQYDYAIEQYFTYRTGFISRAEMEALQELMAYNEIYEVDSNGYIPLILEEDSFQITETRQQLHSLTLPMRPRLQAVSYSGSVAIAVGSAGAWRTTGSSFWQTTFGSTWQIA